VSRAGVVFDPLTGRPEISFTMNSEGASLFAQVTRENVGRQMAIILDGELYSAPRINTEILEGSGVIEGAFTVKEAFELANVLINPLEAPVQIVEERGVDPSLGHDSIRSGIKASIIGALVVSGFMLGLLPVGGSGGERGVDVEHHHAAGGDVFLWHDPDAARASRAWC
jgi:SecD/SecF fusion protein